MTELPHQTKERKSWFSFILKLAFFIIAFALIIFTVLANMGGSGPGMKQAVESFFSDITGYRASIVKFNRMIFFPDIVIDFEHMQLYDGAENTAPVATIGRLQLAMSFWDVMFSTGKIRQMNLEDAVVNAGVLVPAAVKIETARIFDEGGDQAMLEIKGFVDKNPLEIKADMKAFGVAPWKKYRFGDERRVDVSLGGLKLSALVKSQAHEGFSFEGIKLAMPESAAEGSLSFRNRGYGHFAVRGDLRLTENGTALQPDLIFNLEQFPPLLSGVVKIPSLHLNDFKESSRFIRVHDFLRENLLADLRTEIAADVRLDIAAAQGLGDWLGPENTKTLLPHFTDGQGFECVSVVGEIADSEMVFQSLVIDAGAQEIRAAGNYKDEEGLDLKLETLDKSYELKGPFPRPILKSIASAPLPAPLGACVSASPGEASAP